MDSMSGTGTTGVEDECIEVLENSSGPVVDLDCGEGDNPDLGKDICAVTHKEMNGFGEDTEKPTAYVLSLGDLSDTLVTSDTTGKVADKVEVGAVGGADDGDGVYYVVVSDQSDPTKALTANFFAGDVAQGDSFEAAGSFGSETFVHIFSSDGGSILQTINFHTSCSSPLIIGDQYGSITLEGASLEGKDTGTIYTVGLTEVDGDSSVVYEITGGNDADDFSVDPDTGEVTFISPPDFENPTDSDGENTYNVEVTAFYVDAHGVKTGEICEVKPLEVCVADDCIKVLENTSPIIADLDCGDGANPDVGTDICALTDKNVNGFGEDTDKPTSYTLTLGEELTDEINSTQGSKLEVSPLMGADDGDGSYYVVVTRESDPTKSSNQFFAGTVGAGESLTASEAAFGTSFGSETYVHIFASDGGSLLQTINFHTSCSAPLVIGEQYGSVSLEGAALVGKDTGTIYEVGGTSAPGDEGVTYEIKDGPGSDLFVVNEDGEVSFKEAPDFEDPQGLLDADGNPTNNYEVTVICTLEDGTVEEKIFEVCVEDECINILENTSPIIADLDCGDGANPDVGTDICALTDKNVNGFGEDTDKPTSYTLTLGEELTDEINSTQGSKLEVSPLMGADDGDGSYYVVVTRESDPTKSSNQFFAGTVGAGESLTASEAAFGTSFGSETYVHIFASDGGSLLQTINFHTSCSAPLVIGEQYGSVSLEGASLVGKDTGTIYEVGGTSAPGDEGVTYEVDTTYRDGALFEVNADGEVSFIDAPDFEDPQDIGADNKYEVKVLCTKDDGTVEEKIFEVCVEDQGCIKILENTDPGVIADLDCEDQEPENPDQGLDLCAERDALRDAGVDASKLTELTLQLGETLTTDTSTDQGGKLEVGSVQPGDDGDGIYFIRVSNKDNPNDTNENYFTGVVNAGESFSFSSAPIRNEFGAETRVHIFDQDGTFLQTINFHTSCSAPIAIGDQYGSITLQAGAFTDKDTGALIEYGGATPREVVYEITGGDGFDPLAGTSPFFNVDPQTGEVTLAFNPDFENPLDDNGDNNYVVEVTGYFVNADGSREVCEVKPIEICIENEVELGSIAGRYFCDLDDDGLDNNDGDEPAEAGVKVFLQLRDAAGNISFVADTETDANGEYIFEDLPAGDYRVIFAPVGGKVFVDPNVGQMGDMDPTDDSDVIAQNPVTGRGATDFIQLAEGEDRTDVDAGVEFTASLGDFVFEDANADGIQDAGEAGIGGVTVTLTGGGVDGKIGTPDDTTATTTTAADGSYLFEGLNPGEEYQVTFDQAAGFDSVSPANAGGDDTVDSDGLVAPIVTLASGETNTTIDQGFYNTASLGDFVFEDLNGDGIQDAGEPGVEGVTVELKDADGNVVATTTTDAGGKYSFTGLIPGTYSVAFTPPPGFQFTDLNAGGDDALDSDADPAMGGMTQAVVLESGEFNDTLDAGLVRTASLGDFVFEDANADGIQDAGEAGIGGVTVTLTGGGVDGKIGTPDDTTATTTTAADGSYLFEGLNPGEEYQVTFDQAAGFDSVSPANAGGDDTVDSDGLVAPIVTLASGETNTTIDQGFYNTASLGDFVFEDLNGDGIQDAGEPGVEGVTVELKDADGNVVATTTTDAGGKYSFTGLIPGTYSVAFTPPPGFQFTDLNAGGDDALDSDADPAMGGMTQAVVLESGEFNDTLDAGLVRTASLGDFVFEDANADGIQDAGEAGIGGVTVTLTGGGVDGEIGTPDDTTATTTTAADGSYLFEGLNPGEEYQVTFDQAAGFDSVSPANAGGDDTVDSDGLVAPIVTLASGETNTTIDQGFYNTASLGDFVFEDLNGDGIQDAGEPGVEGVTVELKDADGNVVATTTTDAGGKYSFTGLIPGTYSVAFTPPPGFQFTDLNAGGDDALDSDADPAMGGMTQAVVLESGEFNDTLDAGLVQENGRPDPSDDAGKVCADETLLLDLLADNGNGVDSDPDGDPISVQSISDNDETVGVGETLTLDSGATVTLNADGTVLFDGITAYANLVIRDKASESFTYELSDGDLAATGNVDIEICGAKNTLQTIAEGLPNAGSPDGTFFVTVDLATDEYFDVTISGTGDTRFDDTFLDAYCVSFSEAIFPNVDVPFDMYLADTSDIPAGTFPNQAQVNVINWILNQDFKSMDNGDGTGGTYTDAEIQGAIWGVTDNIVFVNEGAGVGTTANANEILNMVNTVDDDGNGVVDSTEFVPEEGDVIGVILNPTAAAEEAGNFQPFIIGVEWDNIVEDCFCF